MLSPPYWSQVFDSKKCGEPLPMGPTQGRFFFFFAAKVGDNSPSQQCSQTTTALQSWYSHVSFERIPVYSFAKFDIRGSIYVRVHVFCEDDAERVDCGCWRQNHSHWRTTTRCQTLHLDMSMVWYGYAYNAFPMTLWTICTFNHKEIMQSKDAKLIYAVLNRCSEVSIPKLRVGCVPSLSAELNWI